MSSQPARGLQLCVLLSLVSLVTLASAADAQLEQGTAFNTVFNVGGPGVRNDASTEGTRGSVGCGGFWGDELTTALNVALNQNVVSENALPLGGRRELWRFCDAMTNQGGGWDVNTSITPEAEVRQNSGFAPAEQFGQADVAQSVAGWQMSAVTNRVQQVRSAMRQQRSDERYAMVTGPGGMEKAVITRSARAAKRAPALFSRANERDAHPSELTLASLLQDGLSSGDDALGVNGLGVFLSGRYVRLDADTTTRELGSSTNGGGFTLGADYRFGSSFVLGGAFGFNHYSTEFSAKAGSSKVDDYAGILFGSLFLGDIMYVDGTLRGSFLTTDTLKRTPALDGGPAFRAQKSSPDGWTISTDLGTGAELPFGALALNPYMRLGVYHTRIDSHVSRGGDGSMNLAIMQQKVTSLPLTLGTRVVYNFSTPAGVISPYVRGQYMHEFLDQAPLVEGFLQVIPAARFRLTPNQTDRNYGSVGGGASMAFARGWSGYVDYDGLVGFFALTTHTATIGIRKEL